MSLRYLTPRDLAHMTPAMIARRRANWAGIIRGLQLEHERKFHGRANAAAFLGEMGHDGPECAHAGCMGKKRKRGMCDRHYQILRRAEKRLDAVA